MLDKSHITHLSVRYKKYRTLILITTLISKISSCFFDDASYSTSLMMLWAGMFKLWLKALYNYGQG